MNSSKKKILILLDWFYPGFKAGGPIQSCVNLSVAMKDDFEVFVLTTDTDHGVKEPYPDINPNKWVSNILPGINICYLKKRTLNTRQIFEEIRAVDPDYIYLNLLFSPHFALYPLWLKVKGKIKAKVMVCPRGTLYDSALSVKPFKKKLALQLLKFRNIQKYVVFHATNKRERKAIEHFFPGSKIIVANNLPSMIQPEFKVIPKESGKLNCVFVARVVAIKNLLFILKILKKVSGQVIFTIVGPVEDREYWFQCEEAMKQLPSNIEVRYLGARRNDELASILQQHHLFILPTTGENFGHAIFESFLAGRPVLISDQTPWLQLEKAKVGWDVPLNDEYKFEEIINKTMEWNQASFTEYARSSWQYAYDFINDSELKQQYLNLFS